MTEKAGQTEKTEQPRRGRVEFGIQSSSSPDEDREGDEQDLNALIDELYSEDGAANGAESINEADGAHMRVVPHEILNTNTTTGLTKSEVAARRQKYGLNCMKEEKHSLVVKFFGFFIGPIQFVMIAAAILAGAMRSFVDFGVILALLLLNAIVGFVQEYHAGSIVDELKKTLAHRATVLRDGELEEVSVEHLVPGDIVRIDEGSVVPADGRLVSSGCHLQLDQSSITGESLAVEKEYGDECYASSVVKRGESFLVITAIGDGTFIGRAASLVREASNARGHFTEVLHGIGTVLLVLIVIALFGVAISVFCRSLGIVVFLHYMLAITVVGVPVGLPAVVTTTLAVGAALLAKKKAIVQRLSAIESLAGVEILCSDKTGTLTKNKLSLMEPFTVEGVSPNELMLTACLAASRKLKGLDPIDKAFLKALWYYPEARAKLMDYKVLDFQPFDPVSKKVTSTVLCSDGSTMVCVKGAPLFVLRTVVEEQGELSDDAIQQYKDKVAEFATRGFRSLGVARKVNDEPFQILGIVPCSDPPRYDTSRTITEAMRLGLKIKMLTGDAIGIAKEMARQLGLGTNVYNAERLGLGGGGEMPGSEVYDFVEGADGFAEVFPQHKYNVVDILQQRGFLVAMTGDGVNDAPSLKKADAGIAVEGASDAARSAADIVFLAPGLSAIIDALKVSRQIFHRMYAYLVYRIALSIHLILFLGLSMCILNESIDNQLVVFLAIFADLATLAIAYDKAPYSMTPVKWNLPRLWGLSLMMGMILAGGTWICKATMMAPDKHGIIEGDGVPDQVLFLEIALTQNWLIFITRCSGPVWSSWPSLQLAGAVLVVDLIATLFAAFGVFTGLVRTSVLTLVRVYVFSLGLFAVMAAVYSLLCQSVGFDRIMHGESPAPSRRVKEDFAMRMQRTSTMHERPEQDRRQSS